MDVPQSPAKSQPTDVELNCFISHFLGCKLMGGGVLCGSMYIFALSTSNISSREPRISHSSTNCLQEEATA